VKRRLDTVLLDPTPWEGFSLMTFALVLGAIGIWGFADDDSTTEAIAALAAAVVGVAGNHIGHVTRQARMRDPNEAHDHFDQSLMVLAVGAGVLGFGLPLCRGASRAAALSLAAAVVGAVVTHLLHERRTNPGGPAGARAGFVTILGFLLLGAVATLIWRAHAEAIAAVVAVFISIGATLLGHGRGEQLGAASMRTEG
jgi:hypothetical protein